MSICFQPFTLRCVSLHLKSPVGSIYSATLHRLIGKLSPFSLKVIDRYVIIANFFLFGSSSLRDFYIVVCLDSFIFCISTVDFCFVVTIRNKGFCFFLTNNCIWIYYVSLGKEAHRDEILKYSYWSLNCQKVTVKIFFTSVQQPPMTLFNIQGGLNRNSLEIQTAFLKWRKQEFWEQIN